MTHDSFRQDVDSRLSGVTFTPELRHKILAAAAGNKAGGTQAAPTRKKPAHFKRRALTLVAACLAVVFGLAAARLVFSSFDELVTNIGQEVASFFNPVSLTSEYDGIRMEVVAAVNDGDSAIVYVTLQDLQGSRVDEATRIGRATFGGWQEPLWAEQAHFDAETGVATFRFELNSILDPIGGAVTELEIHSILFGEQVVEIDSIGYSFADIVARNPKPAAAPIPPEIMLADGFSYSGMVSYDSAGHTGQRLDEMMNHGQLPVLAKDSLRLTIPGYEYGVISAAGVVDGFLHLQFEPQGETTAYNQYSFALEYPGKSWEKNYASAMMTLDEIDNVRTNEEWLFELPPNVPPEKITVSLYSTVYAGIVEGDWAVKFRFEKPEVFTMAVDLETPGNHVHTITVSSLGVTLEGWRTDFDYDSYDYETEQIVVTLQNGEEVEFGTVSGGVAFGDGEEDVAVDKVSYRKLIPLEEIYSVTVYGTEFVLEHT